MSFSLPPWTLTGYSLGGIETALRIPELRLALDVGRGRHDLLRCDHLALTHTHMDHAGGLPYLLALRALYGMTAPTIYVPAQMAPELDAMLQAWAALQRFPFASPIVATHSGERHEIAKGVFLEPFRTYHPVPSNGYTLIRERKRLRRDLVGRPGPELAALRKSGVIIEESWTEATLSVTGDTLPEVLDKQPQIMESETLVLECTFLDDRKDRADARAGGHVHIHDLLERASILGTFRGTLILSHFSQIYVPGEISALLEPLRQRLGRDVLAFPTEP